MTHHYVVSCWRGLTPFPPVKTSKRLFAHISAFTINIVLVSSVQREITAWFTFRKGFLAWRLISLNLRINCIILLPLKLFNWPTFFLSIIDTGVTSDIVKGGLNRRNSLWLFNIYTLFLFPPLETWSFYLHLTNDKMYF